MKHLLHFLFVSTLCLLNIHSLSAQATNQYDERETTAANMRATISNLGLIGNSFTGSFNLEGFSSCEYPVGSGVEHIFEGGLWVGGRLNGPTGEEAVSTGAVDDPQGYSTGGSGFEFTSPQPFQIRSTLFDNPNFTPNAISHQDFVSTFSDTAVRIRTSANNSIPINNHEAPLGIEVDFTSLNWSFNFANFFVILNYRITNVGQNEIHLPYVGFWIDGVIRNVNITPPGGTAFYNKGGNGFIDSLDLAYEFDATGDIGFTDSYVGTKLLGAEYNGLPSTEADYKVNFNTWQFRNSSDPRYFFPTDDLRRYDKMINGLNFLDAWDEIQIQINSPNNRSNLISAGPFPTFKPGDVIEIAFAVVCARRVFDGNPAAANTEAQRANLLQNAGWAQTAYNGEDANANGILDPGEDRDGNGRITRFILPTPPDPPKVRTEVRENAIDVYWAANSEETIDPISQLKDFEGFRLYKTAIGFDSEDVINIDSSLNLVGQWDLPENALFFDTGLDEIRLETPVTFEGDTTEYVYKYTFEGVSNGWQHVVVVTAFDQGDIVNNLESLESSFTATRQRVFPGKRPNPNFEQGEPFAYPNPYYAGADWEGSSRSEEDRKMVFANLPQRAEIRIYSAAGDLIDVIQHDESYAGEDIDWFNRYSEPGNVQFSGGEHAWDLLSADTQIIARGVYLFVVTDKDSGQSRQGKFVVIK